MFLSCLVRQCLWGPGFDSVLVGNSVGWLVTELVGELSSLDLDACNLITLNRCSSEMDSWNFTGPVNAM